MLNQIKIPSSIKRFFTLVLSVSLLVLLAACVPESKAPGVKTGKSTSSNPDPTASAALFQEPVFPLSGTFIQEGSTRTLGNFPIPVNFNDSFLIRGLDLSKLLRKLPNTTKFCISGKYNHVVGSDKFLLMAAKPKSFTDLINKTTEFYLQVEPANDQANQNDCLTYNLSNTLLNSGTSPAIHFSLTQLCATCTSSITSTPLKLFFNNGEEVPGLNLGSLIMSISGSITTSTNSCVESTLCKSRGFDCCLAGQCVKDGAVKPSALTDPAFLPAQEDVANNPDRFVVYPNFYFVCESRPETTVGAPVESTVDPNYDATIRLLELNHLYQCLNQVEGEFSYCTVKFTQASENIPGIFSTSSLGIKDDINFTALNPNFLLNDYKNNIVKVFYAGKVLYELNETILTDAAFIASTENDDLFNVQSINITSAVPSNAQDDNLYLTYKTDGTCEKINSSLARCTKTYIQTSSDTAQTTWHDSSKVYNLPHYADLSASASVIIKIGGLVVPEDVSTWSKLTGPNRIVFNSAYDIFQNQKIEISYFVSSNVDELLKSKTSAQTKVNLMCVCSSTSKCNLKPILNTSDSIVNYECVYPTASSDLPPANQTVFVSNKNVPHRYFDINGVSYDTDFSTAPAQEGTAFTYTNNNTLKPSNKDQYTGFNEINGSFSKSGTYNARPAKYARVKKDQLYDVITTTGAFSSCLTCGSDYYTSLQKIFPQNFIGGGGGYTPDFYESRREGNASIYRGDDLLYGRACFVPATMIPWTHISSTDPKLQRRARLAGQHFLFANGYNRDWYGFDYGSVIGSFDGVSWFSVGGQRRIKAKSGKLFLAVNSFYGDLSVDNNFTVLVSETSPFSSAIPTHDNESDGAECQRAHFCSTDTDCFTNLGYDYTCQNITGLITTWPQFDANGSEVVGSTTKTLASIVGGTNGQSKRCVYRGRGAPCHNNLSSSTTTTFNSSLLPGTLTCSPNNSCMPTSASGFNDRIARFANTPLSQNIAEVTTPFSDILGLAARIIGRPFDYYGSKATPSAALSSLDPNNVNALCVPGRDLASATAITTNYEFNSMTPATRTGTSDKILGIGTTLSGVTANERFLAACPATNDIGTALHLLDTALDDSDLNKFTRAQNLSTNYLNFPSLVTAGIYNVDGTNVVNKVGYQENACLRGAGATCFSDLDCGPSSFISGKVKSADLDGLMNEAEKKFWEEDLVCGNSDFKIVNGGLKNPLFDVKKNRCCREIGKTFTVYTEQKTASEWRWCNDDGETHVAGVNTPRNSLDRYSRVHTAYDKFTCGTPTPPTISFALSLAAVSAEQRLERIERQYNTLDAVNTRTCCTQHWVRSFEATDNGGGHAFGKTKTQNINIEMFKHINWFEQNHTVLDDPPEDSPFACLMDNVNHATSACEVRSFTDSDAEKYLKFAGSLELIGIPQVAVMTNDQIFQIVDDDQEVPLPLGTKVPLIGTIESNDAPTSTIDFQEGTGASAKLYYSAASYENFKMDTGELKKVFSENEFNCCVPSGQQVPDTVTASQCCTGLVANVGGPRRCCLPDFTDVTVYLNRYVSSEGRGLPDNAYDPRTGYIKDTGMVQQIAAQKSLCCSGTSITGNALSFLHIPLQGDQFFSGNNSLTVSRRFIYRTDDVDNNSGTGFIGDRFNAGLRWNNHVYCIPASFN